MNYIPNCVKDFSPKELFLEHPYICSALILHSFVSIGAIEWVYYKNRRLFNIPTEMLIDYKPFIPNTKNWNRFIFYIGFFFLFWIRIILWMIILILMGMCMKIFQIGHDHNKPFVGIRRFLIMFVGRILARIGLLLCGGFWIRQKTVHCDLSPYLGEDHRENPTIRSNPLVYISNHNSYLDILYFMSFCFPSFISKAEVQNYPIIGSIAKSIQCLFVTRDKDRRSNNNNPVNQIEERWIKSENIRNKSPNSEGFPPLMFFPEGTTTNGEMLLSLKRGAFHGIHPIRIFNLKYSCPFFAPHYAILPFIQHFLLLLSTPFICLRVTTLGEDIYPNLFMLQKYKGFLGDEFQYEVNTENRDSIIYARVVQNIYQDIFGMNSIPIDLKQKRGFFDYVYKGIKNKKYI